MSYRDARLRQFFNGYFHEDWDREGAATWQDVVAQYVAATPKRDALLTRDDLREWLEETAPASRPGDSLPTAFGCDYDPRPDGLDEREWARQIAELIDRLAGAS